MDGTLSLAFHCLRGASIFNATKQHGMRAGLASIFCFNSVLVAGGFNSVNRMILMGGGEKWPSEIVQLPNGTNVLKSGPPTKTTNCTVSRGRRRRRSHRRGNLPLASQFVCGPPSTRDANKLEDKWTVRTTKNHQNRHLCCM